MTTFTDQLGELKRRFNQPVDPESKNIVLAELDHTIASLQKIREGLLKTTEPSAEAEIDAKLEALLQPYNTTVEELLSGNDMLPKNCMDARVYMDSICLLESQITKAQKLIDKAQKLIHKAQLGFKTQFTALLKAKLALMVQARKAEADALLHA